MQLPREKHYHVLFWTLTGPTVFWLVIFFVIPFLLLFAYSFFRRGEYGGLVYTFTLDNYVRFADPLYIGIFMRSVRIALIATAICLLLGYPVAFWIAMQPAHKRNRLLLMMMVPYWTNFLIRTYAWVVLLSRNGFVNTWLLNLGVIETPMTLLFNEQAVVIGLVYGWIVEMVLPCCASIVGLDTSLIEAAYDLYANRRRAFLRVILPLTLPGIVTGSILVFILSLGSYVTPDLLGGGKTQLIGNLISQQFGRANHWPFGSAIAIVLMILMLIGTVIYFRITLSGQKAGIAEKGVI